MKFSYPAGFVYLYTALYWITSQGTNIRLAQYIYIIFYILFISIVFTIYNSTKKVDKEFLLFFFYNFLIQRLLQLL